MLKTMGAGGRRVDKYELGQEVVGHGTRFMGRHARAPWLNGRKDRLAGSAQCSLGLLDLTENGAKLDDALSRS